MKFTFVNLGCKINQIEMEQASQGLVDLGYVFSETISDCNFLLINTCTVTNRADKKSWQTIKKYSGMDSLKHVFVTGCYSELEPDLAMKVHSKNHIVAQRDKRRMPEIIDQLLKEEDGDSITHATSHKMAGDGFSAFKLSRISPEDMGNEQVNFFKHTRAFIKIQDGCNAFCSYCRIPFARGAPVSRSRSNIIEHLIRLRENGIREIVLSGINIGKYLDKDTRTNFSSLLRDILENAREMRIKISSIEPFSLDEDFFNWLGHPNLSPHIHLPLQGLSDDILRRMNRRYRLDDYRKIVEKIYRVREDFSIASDVIVGYPGESEDDYQQGKNFIEECGLSKLHIFPFSPRPLTEDFTPLDKEVMEVSGAIRKQRSRDLRNFSQELEARFMNRLKNKKQNMIVESRVNPPSLSTFPMVQKDKTVKTNQMKEIWYQGTTEYNLKGVVSLDLPEQIKEISSEEMDHDHNRGKNLVVRIAQTSPLIFHLVKG